MNKKNTLKFIPLLILIFAMVSCQASSQDPSASCTERDLLLCEDFEDLSGNLGGSLFLQTSLISSWWVTGDDDQTYLYPDFPVDGRSRDNLILVGDGEYDDLEDSFLYSADIDFTDIESASLSFNLIYRTEENWDGLVVFGILNGQAGIHDARNWVLLSPENGYPGSVFINGIIFPGFSGVTTVWRDEIIDLSPVLGNSVMLGFYFSSDEYLHEWGLALDDIVINAPGISSIDPLGPAINLQELGLDLNDDRLVTSKIPRANVVSDVYCDGTADLLLDGQRPYIKALNEPGDRALVLHPTTGQFCWVSQESIWIDGDVGTLARISDLQPEDFYLPICALSLTPVLSTPGCVVSASVVSDKGDFRSYHIQTALVEEGLISAIVLEPYFEEYSETELFDPRTNNPEEIDWNSLFISPGGLLWVEAEGEQQPCFLDQLKTGSVVCEDLSLNAGGPVELKMCWQGFDESQSCPWGFDKRVEGGCLPMRDCSPECAAGYKRSDITAACVPNLDPDRIEESSNLCPAGFSVLSESGCCVKDEIRPAAICPDGYFYKSGSSTCQIFPADGSCPAGYTSPLGNSDCIPADLSTKVLCTEIEQIFPQFSVTVRESTRCYLDARNQNEIVGSLSPFTIVEVEGRDQAGEALLVNNPAYNVPCWAALEDFYLDELDLNIIPIIKSP